MRHPLVLLMDSRCTPDLLGEIPLFLDLDDPRPAAQQFDERYAHGGGWRPQPGFTHRPKRAALRYPGDPPYEPIAAMALRDEMIFVYPYSYVAIFQPDDSFEVCRMD